MRFERDERHLLTALVLRPYQSLVLAAERFVARRNERKTGLYTPVMPVIPTPIIVPTITVERCKLVAYTQLAEEEVSL